MSIGDWPEGFREKVIDQALTDACESIAKNPPDHFRGWDFYKLREHFIERCIGACADRWYKEHPL